MNQSLYVKIVDLTPKPLTRERAREAIRALRARVSDLKGKTVVLDLRTSDSVSGSFLDELILRRNDLLAEGLADLQFAMDSPELFSRLRTNAQIRKTSLTAILNSVEQKLVPDPHAPLPITQSLQVGDVASVPRDPPTR